MASSAQGNQRSFTSTQHGPGTNSGRKPFFSSIFNFSKYKTGYGIKAESGYSFGSEKKFEIRKASADFGAKLSPKGAKVSLSLGGPSFTYHNTKTGTQLGMGVGVGGSFGIKDMGQDRTRLSMNIWKLNLQKTFQNKHLESFQKAYQKVVEDDF